MLNEKVMYFNERKRYNWVISTFIALVVLFAPFFLFGKIGELYLGFVELYLILWLGFTYYRDVIK